jgi:chromosome partitioning protein
MITVFGGIKGGSGKTTLSTNICVERSYVGSKVLLVDADEQMSSSMWSEHRENLEIETKWTTVLLQGHSVKSQVCKMKSDYDEIIIDVGGRDTASQRAALMVADVFVIPFQPRSLDIWTLGKMSSLIDEALSINENLVVFGVINRGDPFGQDNEQAKQAIKDIGNIFCLETVVHNRKVFCNAASEGKGVLEMVPRHQKAIEEIESLSGEIYDIKKVSK